MVRSYAETSPAGAGQLREVEATEFLVENLSKTETTEDFLGAMGKGLQAGRQAAAGLGCVEEADPVKQEFPSAG